MRPYHEAVVEAPKRRLNPQSIALLSFLHVVAAYAVWNAFREPPSAKVWILFFALWLIPQFGITIGYHRMETHNGFKCRDWVRVVLLLCGALAVQGDVNGWVLNHRVHHHFEDQAGLDLHSPLEYPGMKGLLWAHVGWLLCRYERPIQFRTSRRYEADPFVRWQRRWYLALAGASFAIPLALAGWNGLLIAGFLRVVFGLNVAWSTNSICHKWGSRATDSAGNPFLGDESRNNRLVEVLGLGEGYHSNHHAQPACAFHGWTRFSFDPSKWVIQALERLGLVSGVRRPNPDLLFLTDPTEDERRLVSQSS